MDMLPLSQSCFRIFFYYLHCIVTFRLQYLQDNKKSFELHITHMNFILDLHLKIAILYSKYYIMLFCGENLAHGVKYCFI